MELPDYIQTILAHLENAGFEGCCVGGCVRDALLGLTPHDYDVCTNALPQQMKEIFADFPMFFAGEKHGTVSVVMEGNIVVEITTYRTESGYTDCRHPDSVTFVRSLREDLARRDFTVNAMAYAPGKGVVDPFGGQQDLENRILRAVGDPQARFSEDALRILRGVRFSATYRLTPEPETMEAMVRLAPRMDLLARERVFKELCGFLLHCTAEDLHTFAPLITQVIPELAICVGFDQHSPHHAFDVFTHIARVVEAVPEDLPLRWAALLHDVGKPPVCRLDENGRGHFHGHAQAGADIADTVLRRLKAPTALRERVVFLIDRHMAFVPEDKRSVARRLRQFGPEALSQLLYLQKADSVSKGVPGDLCPVDFEGLRQMMEQLLAEGTCLSVKDLAISGRDLLAMGYPATAAMGQCLNGLLEQVVDGSIPNERQALLAAAERYFP